MKISISAFVNSNLETVWACWNSPADIEQWNAASDDWHTVVSSVDFRVGGKFSTRMEAKDGSMGFDFEGIYNDYRKNAYRIHHGGRPFCFH